MISMWLYLIGGFLILMLGAEALVRGGSSLALRLGITPLIIGLTIVAFGTSSPELAVSIQAALNGNDSIALGNIIGSNIANIGLILGVAAIIRPISVQAQVVRREIPIMIAVSIVMWALLMDGQLQYWDGILLTIGIIVYIYYCYYQARKEKEPSVQREYAEGIPIIKGRIWIPAGLIIIGLGMLIGGGTLFVKGAVELARYFGVREAIIGLTIVAVGTSMPELATSVVAAIKKEGDIAIGNVVGSNIFNILGILGIASLAHPITRKNFNIVDFGVMGLYALVLLPFAWSRFSLDRWEGALLLAGYGGYMYYLLHNIPHL